MKLSEIKGERALQVVADLIDPITEMVKDNDFKEVVRSQNRLSVVKYLLKHHSKNVIVILALINGEDPETYEPSLISLPLMLMDLINDPDVMVLFGLQSQTTESPNSGSATENIGATEE